MHVIIRCCIYQVSKKTFAQFYPVMLHRKYKLFWYSER